MRLQSYINEDETYWKKNIELIKKNCKPYIKLVKMFTDTSIGLYRGVTKKNGTFYKITPRKDRRPSTTNPVVHKVLDDIFYDKFGWKARSEGVFVTSNMDVASSYGVSYLFFPIGKFDFLCSIQIDDLFFAIDKFNLDRIIIKSDKPDWEGKIRKKIEPFILDNYEKNNTNWLFSGVEVMFRCKSYYIVKYNDIEQDFMEKIRG